MHQPSARITKAENRICKRMENSQTPDCWVESSADGFIILRKVKLHMNRIKEKSARGQAGPSATAKVAIEAYDNPAHGKKSYDKAPEVRDVLARYNLYNSDFSFRMKFNKMLHHALARWYRHGFRQANQRLPQIQIEENLVTVSRIANWKQLKHVNDSYIMLRGIQSGEYPLILTLDHSVGGSGRLTYRELHDQVRIHLKLKDTCSLRLVPYRPWYTDGLPEWKALPVNDSQCTRDGVFATTLLYYSYHSMQTGLALPHFSSIGKAVEVKCSPPPICRGPWQVAASALQGGSSCSDDDDDDDDDDRDSMTYEML